VQWIGWAAGSAAGTAGVTLFVLLALPRAEGSAALFAAALLWLVIGACAGAASFDRREEDRRWSPALRGLVHCLLLGLGGLAGCGFVAWARHLPLGGAAAAGLFSGLFAFSCGALAHALGGGLARPAVAFAGLALLATFFYWDDAFLLRAEDRKASAELAFELNPAAAAAVSLDYDWIHAGALYTGNETAESMVGIPLQGMGHYALVLALVSLAGVGAGLWRRP